MKSNYYENKYVVRNGSFVGIYNIENDKSLVLSKKLNKESYGLQFKIEYRENKDQKYCVNEYYKIPKGYNLNCTLDLMIIESCIHSSNTRRQLNAKNPKNNEKIHKYLLLSLTAYARTSEEWRDDPQCKWEMRNNGILFGSVLDAYKYYKKKQNTSNSMNREILFKGKSKSTGEWFFGNLFDKDTSGKTHIGTTTKGCFDIDHESVCQFAGFTDINDKKVFEGDYDKEGNCVVFCDECHGWQFGQIDIPSKQICIPCHACDGNFMIGDVINDFEVIGNIND